VDLEQYAVGVHQLYRGEREHIPSVAGGTTGPPIEEATAPLGEVARETGQGWTSGDTLAQQPTVDFTLTLEFADPTTADRALAALGQRPQRSDTVHISDETAVRTIVRTMRREIGREGMRITFAAGGRTFGAEIVSGPGGDFLSNEVSYRALRRLQERAQPPGGGSGQGGVAGAGTPGVSFHVHTPGAVQGSGEALPPVGDTAQSRQARTVAETNARTVLTRLVNTLRRVVVAVARRIARPRGARTP
jgi:hypothetical protein